MVANCSQPSSMALSDGSGRIRVLSATADRGVQLWSPMCYNKAMLVEIDPNRLLSNDLGLCLAHGRLKATITNEDGTHMTISFKNWKRGDRRRNIPIYEAERMFVQVPNQGGWGDKIGDVDLKTGSFRAAPAADPERVKAALNIIAAAQGEATAERIQHPGACMVCGRELTDPVSIDRGIGPDCYGSMTGSEHQQKVKDFERLVEPPVNHIATAREHQTNSDDFTVDFGDAFSGAALVAFKSTTNQRSFDSYTKQWFVVSTAANAAALKQFANDFDLNISDDALARIESFGDVELPAEIAEITIATIGDDITVAFDFAAQAGASDVSLRANFDDMLRAVKSIETPRRFDGVHKHWVVAPTGNAADVLREMCKTFRFEISDEATAKLKEATKHGAAEAKTAEARIALSKADDADIDLGHFGFEPFAFQRAGIAYGDLAHDRYMIADEQGLGKTIQALGRIQVKQQFPAVVVCPSAVKIKWARACKQAFNGDRTVEVLEGKTPTKLEADITIINYDVLSFWSKAIIGAKPMALILDESHYIKNRKAKRTVAAKAIAKAIPKDGAVILLSGTPILNRPIELVEQLDAMGRLTEFGGSTGFISRYVGWERNDFAGGNVPVKNGAMNLPELNKKLRATCFVRRLKKDVLPELPEKRRDVVPIAMDTDAYAKAYQSARKAVRDGLSKTEQLVEIQNLRRAAVEAKLDGCIDWITDFLESDEKLVVFARHRDVQSRIHEAFPGSVRIAGVADQTKQARQDAMDDFQNNPDIKLAVVSLDAGREGIDLYAASNLAFVELGWNPGVHDQAEDRIHRIGQDRGTMMYYLLAEGTIDEEMSRLIESKRRIKDAATEGQEILDEPDYDMVGNLVRWLAEEDEAS